MVGTQLEEVTPSQPHDGSVKDILEASQTTLEVKAISLTKSQVGLLFRHHTKGQGHKTDHTTDQGHQSDHTGGQGHESDTTRGQGHQSDHTRGDGHPSNHTGGHGHQSDHTRGQGNQSHQVTGYFGIYKLH